ncbi:SDR family oxidoreductase [Cohnella fermenti]|uniref:SDR family oxidoreductase n=1 Tax=Cohnella fermenti TaxID=2565925 RepID=A0A4S4C4Q2_9BACL|nr:SDR family oxidoreductase [Cohnella fermenti]THF82134.1 SDR family oxidoreductase [Cohnella fermenti]
MNDNRLRGQNVAIIGAGGGIGQAVAKAIAAKGARLALGSRQEPALKELADALTDQGAEAIYHTVDVTNERDVMAFFERAAGAFGRLDTLVNLAGLSVPSSIVSMTEEQYDQTIDVNLKGSFLCAKHFVPRVDSEQGGLIVHTGSMAAKRANPGAPLYCTAKAAVNMFSQGLALQLIEKNIRVTTVNPGAANTGFWGQRQVPRDKFMSAGDVADMIVFLIGMNPRVVVHEVNFESFASFK